MLSVVSLVWFLKRQKSLKFYFLKLLLRKILSDPNNFFFHSCFYNVPNFTLWQLPHYSSKVTQEHCKQNYVPEEHWITALNNSPNGIFSKTTECGCGSTTAEFASSWYLLCENKIGSIQRSIPTAPPHVGVPKSNCKLNYEWWGRGGECGFALICPLQSGQQRVCAIHPEPSNSAQGEGRGVSKGWPRQTSKHRNHRKAWKRPPRSLSPPVSTAKVTSNCGPCSQVPHLDVF